MAICIVKNSMTEPIKQTCKCCMSEYTFTYEDINRREINGLFNCINVERFTICPVCKYDNILSKTMIKEGEKNNE